MADKKFLASAFRTRNDLSQQPPLPAPQHYLAAQALSVKVLSALLATNFANRHFGDSITDQLGRCIMSVPANIIEGWSRRTPRNELQFARTARGSAMEAHYFLGVLVSVEGLVCPDERRQHFAALDAELMTVVMPLLDAAIVNMCEVAAGDE